MILASKIFSPLRRGLAARVVAVLAVAGSVICSQGTAHAADPVDVEALIRQGNELRTKGSDQAALPLFRKAYDLGRSPRTAAQLGLVELQMGYALEAEQHLAEALASPRHLWVVRNRAQIEDARRAASAAIGSIEVSGTPAGAQVLLNGVAAGALPLEQPVRFAEGLVRIAVRADGFAESVKDIRLAGGSRQVVVVALERLAGQTHLPAAATSTPPGAPPSGLAAEVRAAGPRETSAAPDWVRPAAWTASVLGVAALGFGGYQLVRQQQRLDAFNDQRLADGERACSTAAPNLGDSPLCSGFHQDARAAQTKAIVGLGAAGLFAAAAVAGFLWSTPAPSREAAAPRSALVATIARDGGLTVISGWRAAF